MVDSFIKDTVGMADPESITIEKFLSSDTKRPKLIYCKDEDKENYFELSKKFRPGRFVQTNCKDWKYLRSLEDETVIITDLELIRGVDYKSSDGKGLELLIAHTLPTKRALIQLLGRVGRYNEDCARFKLEGMTFLVDEEQASLTTKSIYNNSK